MADNKTRLNNLAIEISKRQIEVNRAKSAHNKVRLIECYFYYINLLYLDSC